MTKGPEGCGVLEHAEECLCDVVITNPTKTQLSVPHDMLHGSYIAEKSGWSAPFTREKLADFFDTYMDVFNQLWRAERAQELICRGTLAMEDGKYVVKSGFGATYPEEVFEYIKKRIQEHARGRLVADEIWRKYGYNIGHTTVYKIRKRMIEWGEYVGE